MKTIAIASAKGGSGKSSLTTALAVRASLESMLVVMMDLNSDQASLTQWWIMRGSPLNPRLIADLESVPQDMAASEFAGFEWMLIDTPPIEMDVIEQAVAVADLVLIPVKASIFDVNAVEAVTSMCRDHRKPFAFVLSDVDSKFASLNEQVIRTLKKDGHVLTAHISHRMPYVQALTAGKSGPELKKDLAPEIDALWLEVKDLIAKGAANA